MHPLQAKNYVIALFCTMLSSISFAQDPIFSQFYANPLYLNPALAGSERCPRVILNYRNQWPQINQAGGNYVTYAASYDQHIDALSGGVGLSIMHDREGSGGIFKTNRVNLAYAYNQTVTKKFSMRFALEASYFNKALDWSQLTFGDMIDERYGFIYPTAETPAADRVQGVDFSAGWLGYTKNFYGGFAVHHLTEPKVRYLLGEDAVIPRKLTLHTGWIIPLNKRFPDEGSISPNILFQQQGKEFGTNPNARQIYLGLYGNKGPFTGGVWYRGGDAFIVLVGIKTDYVRFGYSYDITTSKLTNRSGGSHEISTAFLFNCKPKRKKFRPIACPKF
jgi:type IX secretion system PorP/SprF family membrane protein